MAQDPKGLLIVKDELPTEQLVYLTVARSIHEDGLLAACQALSKLHAHRKGRLPRRALYRVAIDLDVDSLGPDVFVRCDRSNGQRNSPAQGSGHQAGEAASDHEVLRS